MFLINFGIFLTPYWPGNIKNGLSTLKIISEVTFGHTKPYLIFNDFQSKTWLLTICHSLRKYYWSNFNFYLLKQIVCFVKLIVGNKIWRFSISDSTFYILPWRTLYRTWNLQQFSLIWSKLIVIKKGALFFPASGVIGETWPYT